MSNSIYRSLNCYCGFQSWNLPNNFIFFSVTTWVTSLLSVFFPFHIPLTLLGDSQEWVFSSKKPGSPTCCGLSFHVPILLSPPFSSLATQHCSSLLRKGQPKNTQRPFWHRQSSVTADATHKERVIWILPYLRFSRSNNFIRNHPFLFARIALGILGTQYLA